MIAGAAQGGASEAEIDELYDTVTAGAIESLADADVGAAGYVAFAADVIDSAFAALGQIEGDAEPTVEQDSDFDGDPDTTDPDVDNDGTANEADTDDDGDGDTDVEEVADDFNDGDADDDGIFDEEDTDDDGDGLGDAEENEGEDDEAEYDQLAYLLSILSDTLAAAIGAGDEAGLDDAQMTLLVQALAEAAAAALSEVGLTTDELDQAFEELGAGIMSGLHNAGRMDDAAEALQWAEIGAKGLLDGVTQASDEAIPGEELAQIVGGVLRGVMFGIEELNDDSNVGIFEDDAGETALLDFGGGLFGQMMGYLDDAGFAAEDRAAIAEASLLAMTEGYEYAGVDDAAIVAYSDDLVDDLENALAAMGLEVGDFDFDALEDAIDSEALTDDEEAERAADETDTDSDGDPDDMDLDDDNDGTPDDENADDNGDAPDPVDFDGDLDNDGESNEVDADDDGLDDNDDADDDNDDVLDSDDSDDDNDGTPDVDEAIDADDDLDTTAGRTPRMRTTTMTASWTRPMPTTTTTASRMRRTPMTTATACPTGTRNLT